jgi:hypothetical protein
LFYIQHSPHTRRAVPTQSVSGIVMSLNHIHSCRYGQLRLQTDKQIGEDAMAFVRGDYSLESVTLKLNEIIIMISVFVDCEENFKEVFLKSTLLYT